MILVVQEVSGNYPLPWMNIKGQIKIAVVGDTILDEYLDGRVDRISPEAPVPVHLVESRTYTPGGAANAAMNIKLSGGEAQLFSIAGEDEACDMLFDFFKKEDMQTDGILKASDRPTIRKTRITTKAQQLVRIDWERVRPLPEGLQRELFAKLERCEFDAILISDYGKGVLPDSLIKEIIALGHKRDVPIVVDPKGTNFSKYYGATLVKPNHKEACEALGLDASVERDGETLARLLNEKFKFKNSLVTLGPRGMVLVSGEQKAITKKSVAREVFDVSGAGDCVAALVTLCLASGVDNSRTLEIANAGAGLVVGKWGTQPVKKEELAQSLLKQNHENLIESSASKVVTLNQAKQLLTEHRAAEKRIVFTNGCFDILHAGHLSYLEKARNIGDILVVGINSDTSITKLKGPARPIVDQTNRASLLAGLKCVDYVIVFEDDTPEKLINELSPNVLIKGADWDVENIVGAKHVLDSGGTVETVDLLDGMSTTKIIETVLNKHDGK